jgi:drug/metabolite transporter (DMT)-like permease
VDVSRRRIFTVLGIGVFAVSLAAIFIRMADAPGVMVAAYRLLIAALVLLPWTLRALYKTPLKRANLPYVLGAGIFLGAHFATWISSLSYTTVAASVALVSTNPLWVALLSWVFLKSPPSVRVLAGALVAVIGGVMIGFGDFGGGSDPLLGDALAVLGAICMSCYLLLGRSAQRRGLSLQAYIGVAYAVAALVLLPLPLLFGFSYLDYSAETFLWILLLALVPQLIGHTSINYAIKQLEPTVVATVILLEPIGSAVLALIVFQEIPAGLTALGAAALLAGVALAAWPQEKRVRSTP